MNKHLRRRYFLQTLVTAGAALPLIASGQERRPGEAIDQPVEQRNLTYIKDYGSHTISLRKFRKTRVDPSNWSSTLQAAADSGEPTIRVHADAPVTFADQWSINEHGQKWVGDGEDNSSLLKRTTIVDEAAIVVRGERNGMRHIGIQCASFAGMSEANVGVHVIRPDGEPADQDFTFRDGYISGFYYLAKNRGRGFSFINSLLTSARYCIDLDWPADRDYVEGSRDIANRDTGFRRLLVDGCEFHAIQVAGVRNRGANAANAHLIVRNCYSNIGDGIFAGYLGDGSVIENCTVTHANTIPFQINGGTNYTMRNNSVSGTRATIRSVEPTNFMTMTGHHTGFVINGFHGTYCRKHGIDMHSGDFQGVIRNVDLCEIGSAGASDYSGVNVIGTGVNTEILADGVSLRNASAAQTVFRMNAAGSVLKHRGVVALGAATPTTGGAGTRTAV
ncbi:right-handed parallel beta-helix repeat-containing protein [Sinorhizobium meliloti]|uniref:right-handed parallel beta-helix repeat-containing protein n=1 Tax=Rhizobium meliloti TaxID=382 RepID=UPI003D653F9E